MGTYSSRSVVLSHLQSTAGALGCREVIASAGSGPFNAHIIKKRTVLLISIVRYQGASKTTLAHVYNSVRRVTKSIDIQLIRNENDTKDSF